MVVIVTVVMTMVMVMTVVMIVGMIVPVPVPVIVIVVMVAIRDQGEAQRGNAAAHALFEARRTGAGGHHRSKVGEHPRPQLGKRVDQRRDEHVTRGAADGVEMNVQTFRHHFTTGTT